MADEEIDYDAMENKLQSPQVDGAPLHKEDLIYRVGPPLLSEDNKTAFEPFIISIGPYHQDKKNLKAMEYHKKRYMHQLLCRNHPDITSFKALAKKMEEMESEARKCYSEEITLKRDEFVEMLCLDGSFIVELFLKLTERLRKEDDLLSGPIWRLPSILRDLLLLENQLPFFILREIFSLVGSPPLTLEECSLQVFFENYKNWENKKVQHSEQRVIHHLLHLLHIHVSPASEKISTQSPKQKNKFKDLIPICSSRALRPSQTLPSSDKPNSIPCARALEDAGVKFTKKKEGGSFLEITFEDGVMEMPYLWVDNSTESMFRNFIALEQCCFNTNNHHRYFTQYVTVMDSIVNTQKDVQVLYKKGIMEHGLGSDNDVALLFNNMKKGATVNLSNQYISSMYGGVTKHCNRKWNVWRAALFHNYFHSPWSFLSLLAALLALFLTFLNAMFNTINFARSRS